MTRNETHPPLAALFALILALAGPTGCGLLPGSEVWDEQSFEHVSLDDVFAVSVVQLDRDYAIKSASRSERRIETDWDYDSISPGTRYLQRERVIAEIDPSDDGIALRLRVHTQVKERTGLLGEDDRNSDGWTDGRDDVERSAVLLQRIRSILVPGRPSDDFYERTPLFPGADEEAAGAP